MFFHIKSLATILAITPSFILAIPHPNRAVDRDASGTQTAIVTVTPSGGAYYGDITVDGKVRKVLFDTGSDVLWLNNYGQKASGTPFHQGYGSGSVSGTVTYGDVTVGGITVHNQAFGLVYHAEGTDQEYDGLIGLGTSAKPGAIPEASWLNNVSPMLKQPIFKVDLEPKASGALSTFTFGYDNQSSTSGNGDSDAIALPISSRSQGWDISVNMEGLDRTISCDLDTGTTDMYIPRDAYNAYFNNGVDRCGSNLPDLKITSNGHTLNVPGKYVAKCGENIKAQDDDTCNLGQPFIQAYYTTYDYTNKQVTLVPKA